MPGTKATSSCGTSWKRARRNTSARALLVALALTPLVSIAATAQQASANAEAQREFDLGRAALRRNDVDAGIRHFENCVRLDDLSSSCHAWVGNALGSVAERTSKLKLPFLAKRIKKEFDRAVELDPENLEGRWGLMQYYLQAPGMFGGSKTKAREQAAEIEKLNKLRGALAFGLLADKDRNVKEAETAYQRAIAAAPDSVAGYNALVNVYVREKRWTEAFGVLDQVMSRIPSEHGAWLAVARVAYLSGEQLARGEELAKRWIAGPPRDASVNARSVSHQRLGAIYEKTGRTELARTEYGRAVSINPRNEDAKRSLGALK